MSDLQEVRRSPVEIWGEIERKVASIATHNARIDAILAEVRRVGGSEASENHHYHLYVELTREREQLAELIEEAGALGLVGEIGQYLAVTYGGRP